MTLAVVSGHGGTSSTVAKILADEDTGAVTRQVVVHHVTAHDKLEDGKGYQYITIIDFEGCSEADILEAAADSLIIKMRSKLGFRASQDPESLNGMTVKAADLMLSSKRSANPEKTKKKVVKDLMKLGMTEAQIAEVLANLK